MPMFTYKARNKEGKLIVGQIQANSALELKEALFHEGMVPIDVSESRIGMQSLQNMFDGVKDQEIMIFTRQFYTLFKAGVSIDSIMDTMIKQTKNKFFENALERVKCDIAAGATLAQAFSRHPKVFNELYVAMLSAGEEAGILEEVLLQLSDLQEKEFEIKRGIKGATLYPKIVMVVLFLAVTVLMIFVVPGFTSFYSGFNAELPLPTRILTWISNFFVYYWYILFSSIAGIYYLYRRYYNTNTGKLKIDKIRMTMPVFGQLNMKVANARFGHILSALYRSGMPMPKSLEVVSRVIDNAAFSKQVLHVREDIQMGATLSEGLGRQSYFPPVVVETAGVGERSGALDEMLSTIAEHFDSEVKHSIKNLTTMLEPIMLVFIFSFVGLLALAIFLPIWNLSSVVNK